MDDNFQVNAADIPTAPPPLTLDQRENLEVWIKEVQRLGHQTAGEPAVLPPNIWDDHWARGGPGRTYFTKR